MSRISIEVGGDLSKIVTNISSDVIEGVQHDYLFF